MAAFDWDTHDRQSCLYCEYNAYDEEDCAACAGTGLIDHGACIACEGHGFIGYSW